MFQRYLRVGWELGRAQRPEEIVWYIRLSLCGTQDSQPIGEARSRLDYFAVNFDLEIPQMGTFYLLLLKRETPPPPIQERLPHCLCSKAHEGRPRTPLFGDFQRWDHRALKRDLT